MIRKHLSLAFLVVASVASTGVARDVPISSTPSGALVEVTNIGDTRLKGGATYRTNVVVDFKRRAEPYTLKFSLPEHETIYRTYDYATDGEAPINVTLQRIVDRKTFNITSEPAGADVYVDGNMAGKTPLRVELTFRRSDSRSDWSTIPITVRKENYAPEGMRLGMNSDAFVPPVKLTDLRREITFDVNAQSDLGDKLAADLILDGSEAGATPASFNLVFTRETKAAPWTTHTLRAWVENAFLPQDVELTVTSKSPVNFTLAPVTEVPVLRAFPMMDRTPRGPRQGFDMSSKLGTLDVRDISSPAVDIRPVTNFQRNQTVFQTVNSFCLTPDGQRLIYGVTMQREDSGYYSNLFIKDATDQSFAFSQLTRGTRFLDSQPRMAREEGSTMVVFQSNRGPIESLDVSSFQLREGRVVGGIQQLTRDGRLNSGPSLVSEQQPVFFSSADTFPMAEPFISRVRLDGSTFTNLGETGEMLNLAESGLIYFVKPSEDTSKLQIYSVTTEGLQFSSVINDMQFATANCFGPSVSLDGSKLLFVSDYHQDERGRNNNNLYIFDLAKGRIQQLTDNGSDDIAPMWSPTEPGIIYFLSNRGGVYNIWRMKVLDVN